MSARRSSRPDFRAIAGAALAGADRVLAAWLPGGTWHGREYQPRNPKRPDRSAGSFSINAESGKWKDFATGDAGADLVSLVAYLEDCPQGKAAEKLAAFLGIDTGSPASRQAPPADPRQGKDAARAGKAAWQPILPVPEDAPKPPAAHPKRGRPSHTWRYRDEAGRLLFEVMRFEAAPPAHPRKDFYPLCFAEGPDGRRDWRFMASPAPRPLFNLHAFADRPESPVIVAEGEKAADAAGELLPDCLATTWPGGAAAVKHADFAPLKGRRVLLWPDADEPGMKAMHTAGELARQAGAAAVEVVRHASFWRYLPRRDKAKAATLKDRGNDANGIPAGYDAADAFAAGWQAEHVRLLAERGELLAAFEALSSRSAGAAAKGSADVCSEGEGSGAPAAGEQTGRRTDRFTVTESGTFYYTEDKSTGELRPLRLCAELSILAKGRDPEGRGWCLVASFRDADGMQKRLLLPLAWFVAEGAEHLRALADAGLQIEPGPHVRRMLTEYLMGTHVDRRARVVSRTGWHGRAYVFATETIGPPDASEELIFEHEGARPAAFRRRGTLEDWKREVAEPCQGNSRLVLALCWSLAGPLLRLTGNEGGGLNLVGPSSEGKTTALHAAASIWGPPSEYVQTWRATSNGLEGLAASHSDAGLILDELGQCDPKEAGAAAYLLASGKGKARAGRSGELRQPADFVLTFLSSGETDLAGLMRQAGREAAAGQLVRALDLPANPGRRLGVFDHLAGEPDGAALARRLKDAAARCHGTAAPAFIAGLIELGDELPRGVRAHRSAFEQQAKLPADASGQVLRGLHRFALAAAAGELAQRLGVVPWPAGEANAAALTCFRAWLAYRGGLRPAEELALLRQVRRFFEAHGEGRFTDYARAENEDSHMPKTLNRAGWRKVIREEADGFDSMGRPRSRPVDLLFFVLPEVARAELFAGFEPAGAARVLAAEGFLKPGAAGEWTRRESIPAIAGKKARVYVFTAKAAGIEDDEPEANAAAA